MGGSSCRIWPLSARALIDFIIRNLLALWPDSARLPVGARLTNPQRGLIIGELGPGLHWRWWFVDEVKKWPSNEVALDLETGSVVTADGQPVSISANMSYRMTSIALMYKSLWHSEKTLGLIAVGHIASDCAAMTWLELRNRRTVEANLLASLNDVMAQRGIEVLGVRLTDCVPSRAYRHYHDGKVPV